MYCPTCGNSLTDGLKYCNSCGERLRREVDDKDAAPEQLLEKVTTALCVVVVFGLGILVGLVAVMLGSDVKPELVAVLAFGYLATIFGISFMLARQVPKLIDARLRSWNQAADMRALQPLSSQTTAQLKEYREPVMSVTDHTTKTLDKIPLRDN